ncbi:ABC transporter ATP-binding protein [Bacillus sp. 7504-2]|nr:ABC transporter ATP-binding protein [Bacillus sp. 7504-2]
MLMIETKQLSKVYGVHDVVKGIDLTVRKGEIFGFLGRNGAGKSTFINMLTGIISPSSGKYFLMGKAGPDANVMKKVGVMPDYSSFYSNWTAMDHLQFFSALSSKKASKIKCVEILKKVDLVTHANKKTGKFSFGMKKKLAIAQAIIHEPELIFLDEPTSGMDIESAIHIHRLISELQEQGKTIFMTSHNLAEVEKICTRIAIMRDGIIDKIGTMEELRSFYRSTITVRLKHAKVPKLAEGKLKQWLESAGTIREYGDTYTVMIVWHEQKIAEMIRAFTQCKTDVFRVDVEEPTLEEIFLNEEE